MTLPLKIVVADDDRDTREYLQEYLRRLGHEVMAAEDGRRLVALCREFTPDLVVTDYAMPGLDGLAAAREVNRHRRVPVILFSGRQEAEARAQAEVSSIIKVLLKPLQEAELRAAVESVPAAVARSGDGPTGE